MSLGGDNRHGIAESKHHGDDISGDSLLEHVGVMYEVL